VCEKIKTEKYRRNTGEETVVFPARMWIKKKKDR